MMLSQEELNALRDTTANARNWLATREGHPKAGWEAADTAERITKRLVDLRTKCLDKTPAVVPIPRTWDDDNGESGSREMAHV